MVPARILRMPIFRSFSALSRSSPVLPFTSRQAAMQATRGPSLTLGRTPLTRRSYSTSPPPSPTSSSSAVKPTTLTGRLKLVIKTHGWYALGVYLGLSVLDFTLTFAGIYLLGADKVGAATSKVISRITETVGWPFPTSPGSSGHDIDEGTVPAAHGGGNEGLYAIAFLAYGIHKTLWMPFRIGLTAAVTPRFVAFLTRRGWVGKGGVRRAVEETRNRARQGSLGTRSTSSGQP